MSWAMWICRRSCEEMGGASVCKILVKVGRARERSSPPGINVKIQSTAKGTIEERTEAT